MYLAPIHTREDTKKIRVCFFFSSLKLLTMKKASSGRSKNKNGKFCLLRWLGDDEQVSVVLSSSIRPGQKCYTGAHGEFKWQAKYYEAEVLKMSGRLYVFGLLIYHKHILCR